MTTFDELYSAHYETVRRHAEIACGLNDDQAEQLATDAFYDLHQALERGVEIEHPAALLCKQVRIRAALYARRECRVRRGGRLMKHDLKTNYLAVEHKGFESVDAKDTVEKLWVHLTEMEKKIATLAFMQDYTQREIAQMLEMPLRTVQRNVTKLRRKLRALLV